MKGGITSGIVYPNAVLALAREYRFKSSRRHLGRRHCGRSDGGRGAGRPAHRAGRRSTMPAAVGFSGLAGSLRATVDRQGFIRSLFQPACGARNAYRRWCASPATAGLLAQDRAVCSAAVLATAPLEFAGRRSAGCSAIGYPRRWHRRHLGDGVAALVLCAYARRRAASAAARRARGARATCSDCAIGSTQSKRRAGLTDWLHAGCSALPVNPDRRSRSPSRDLPARATLSQASPRRPTPSCCA